MLFPGFHKYVHWRVARAERRGDAARAERIASKAAHRRPSDCAVRLVWAAFQTRQRQLAQAERIIRETPEPCSTDYQLQCLLAGVLHLKGERGEAERVARALIERKPEQGDAWASLAAIVAGAGRYDEALQLVGKATERELSAPRRANAASIAIFAGEQELAESLARDAVRQDPRNPTLHILLAVLLERRGDPEAKTQWRLAERYRRRVPEEMYLGDVEHYRALIAKFGMRRHARASPQEPEPS